MREGLSVRRVRRTAVTLLSLICFGQAGLGAHAADTVAEAAPQTGKSSIALILDASGSMNEKLSGNVTKLTAAKNAVLQLVGTLPKDIRMSFQAYGLQFGLKDKNCNDIQKLVGFAPLGENAPAIAAATKNLSAKGYTPITQALTLAAQDIAGEYDATTRTIILVSDGKETCSADPCEAARALAKADVKLVIDTVGFGVDDPAKEQLQCVARVARGTYFDAKDAEGLTQVLKQATVIKQRVKLEKRTGKLTLKGVELIDKTFIVSDESKPGEATAYSYTIDRAHPTIDVAPGSYAINFGVGVDVHQITVAAGKETVVGPSIIEIRNGDGLDTIYDTKSGLAIGIAEWSAKAGAAFILLPPGDYDVQTDFYTFKGLSLAPGERKVIDAARVTIRANGGGQFFVKSADGTMIGDVTPERGMTLPGGHYLLSDGTTDTPFELKDGQRLELEVGG